MADERQTTPEMPSRAAIYNAVHTLTNGFGWKPGQVSRYLASIYPQAPGPDVGGDPRNVEWVAQQMREIANAE